MKLPQVNRSPGFVLHSSIWLVNHAPGYVKQPRSCHQEIDVVEQYAGGAPPNLRSTAAGAIHSSTGSIHGGSDGPCKATCCNPQEYVRSSRKYSSQWTTFELNWSSDQIAISIDGIPVQFFNRSVITKQFTDPLFLAITACVMNRLPPGSGDALPLEYFIDSVEVWEIEQ